MKLTWVLFILLPAGLAGDETTERAKLFGNWVLDNGRAPATTWIIRDVAAGLHVTESQGAVTVANFECGLEGHECSVKISGHKATVSLYFNGRALVELETIGSKVLKRRFSILPSGTAMRLEEIPMTGAEAPRDFQFEREQVSERRQ